tara:strand:+ start:291 stop:812 length:522 start_codon:yes stop_codon:yes gene_type:complete
MSTTPKPIPREIADRLQAAQKHATAVEKGSRNDFAKYDYASAEEIIGHVRPLFSEHGLGVFRIGWEPLRWVVTNDGEAAHKVKVWFQITAAGCQESWITSVIWPVVVTKGRPEDKAEASALTDATKYWLLGILLLPRADVEMDQRPDTVAHGQRTSAPAKAGSKSKAVADGQI